MRTLGNTDAFLLHFLTKTVGAEPPKAAAVLQEFRKYRESQGGAHAPTASDYSAQIKERQAKEEE